MVSQAGEHECVLECQLLFIYYMISQNMLCFMCVLVITPQSSSQNDKTLYI